MSRIAVTTGQVFDMFAGECQERTGMALREITVDIGGFYVSVVGYVSVGLLDRLKTFTLYFAQDEEAFETMATIDLIGREKWLSVLFGATEFFTEAQEVR